MINIALPDGSIKSFENAPTGLDVARSISEGLARNSIAVEVDGRLLDLSERIIDDCRLRLITNKDKEALEILRHGAAHVMAQAILHLYKDAKLTIGPVVEDGFYYDIDMEPISKDDFPKIEEEI
ncbi:MAG: TGS domain-containing protein, partial [Desulfobacterales bacterium]|nr:TGS domain-containing protein [Desulfobacterales bacterium]